MNNNAIESLIRGIDPSADFSSERWRFKIGSYIVVCRTVALDDAVSLEIPLTDVKQVDRDTLLYCLEVNSGGDTDACFRIVDGGLFGTITRDLDLISNDSFLNALRQVVVLAETFESHIAGRFPDKQNSVESAEEWPIAASNPNWVPLLKALSDNTRLKIIAELLYAPRCVEELATRLDLNHYNACKHLRILREAGVIESSREGRLVISAIAHPFHNRIKNRILDLGCCSFRFELFPDRKQTPAQLPSLER